MKHAVKGAAFKVPAPIVFATLVLFLAGCEPQGITIMDRLSAFGAGLNQADRTGMQLNFSKSDTQDYTTISNAAWWTTDFPVPTDADHIYSIVVANYEDPDNVTGTILGPPGFNVAGTPIMSAVFVMVKEDADWFIRSVSFNGTVVIQ